MDPQKWLLIGRGFHICSLIYVRSVLSVTWRSAGAQSTDLIGHMSVYLTEIREVKNWDVQHFVRRAQQQAQFLG
jgi:hypothetical protein